MDPVWLFKIGSHLGQQFVAGDADIDGKAETPVNGVFDLFCGGQRALIAVSDTCEIQITLIYTDLLNIRSQCLQIIDKPVTVLPVQLMIRRKDQKLRAFFQSGSDRFAGIDPHFFRGNGLGKDDPVPAFLISADDGRNFTQIRTCAGPKILNRRPAEISRIYINMKNDPRSHRRSSFQKHFCLLLL